MAVVNKDEKDDMIYGTLPELWYAKISYKQVHVQLPYQKIS